MEKSIIIKEISMKRGFSFDVPWSTDSTENSECSSNNGDFELHETFSSQMPLKNNSQDSLHSSFTKLRLNYLLVTLAVMLADGLQGTHLYVLYDSYGFSVASLYSLGFVTGAVTTPLTGPLIDTFGRRRCAILYCLLEIWINMLEQYPFLAGLIVSRMVGGVTTNILSSVFEAWLDTEYRRRGIDESKYEIIMRDSVVLSNLAAIFSGYLAHVLAERFGPVGPFQGAVSCTALALVVIMVLWNENYGDTVTGNKGQQEERIDDRADGMPTSAPTPAPDKRGVGVLMQEAMEVLRSDSRVLRVGIIQGLTVGSLQIFIFLWSPTLQKFCKNSPRAAWGLDHDGEPAYGLIFGAFMAAGVVGGICSPWIRQATSLLLSPLSKSSSSGEVDDENSVVTIEGEGEVRPMAVEFLASTCYIICATLLLVPFFMDPNDSRSFSISLSSMIMYEFLVGVAMPCEGVIRSLYLPADARATMMTLPRMIVNLAVSLGVILTKSIATESAFGAIAFLMTVAAALQLSLVSKRAWGCFYGRMEANVWKPARRFSVSALNNCLASCSTSTVTTTTTPERHRSPRSSLNSSFSSTSTTTTSLASTPDLQSMLTELQDWCFENHFKLD